MRAVRGGTASLVSAISSAQREIDLLHEYRTGLIADIVTVKLDVREAAARLQDETEAHEPLDEADEDADETSSNDADEILEETKL